MRGRRTFGINTRAGYETRFIYPYDSDFFSKYGDFLDRLDQIATDRHLTDQVRANLHHMFDPSILVDLMIHEEIGDNYLGEGFIDLLNQSFDEWVAAATADLVAEFITTSPRPYGFSELCQVVARYHTLSVVRLEAMREHDAQIYILVPLSDDLDDC